MNSLLSGLANSQGGGGKGGGGDIGGIFGGNSIIWILILLFLCGGLGQGQNTGTVCGCEPKHCKELCRCGSSGNAGLCGLGGLGGLGSGTGCWWIIILIFLFACNGKENKCKHNDDCDE